MSRIGSPRSESIQRDEMPRTLGDCVAICRFRWRAASLAFILVSAGVATHALLSTPVYRSTATIQIEKDRGRVDLLAELPLLEGNSTVEAELEVMRSFTVAAHAVTALRLTALVQQEQAHRPWNQLARSIQGEAPPSRLSLRVPDGWVPLRDATYSLTFDAIGQGFALHDAETDAQLGTWELSGSESEPFELQGAHVVLRLVDGQPAGRTFRLSLRTPESAARWLQQHTVVEQVGPRTGVVHLGFEAESPQLARRVAQGLAHSYLERKLVRKQERLDKRIAWLDGQIERVDQDLREALDARDAYIVEHGAVLLGEKARAAFAAHAELVRQRLAQQQELAELQAALEALSQSEDPSRALAAIGAAHVDAHTQAAADHLAGLEIARGALRRQKTPAVNPQVKRLDAEIAEGRSQLTERIEALRGEVMRSLERKIDAIGHRLEQIDAEREKHDAQLAELPENQRQLAELARDVEALDRSLAFLVRTKGEAQIARESTLTSAYMVDPALFPLHRSSPVLYLHGALALFLGALAAVGTAFLAHARDRSLRSALELEQATGLRLYASIPQFESVRKRDRRGLAGSLVARDVPFSPLAECYRALRANIRFADRSRSIQTLTITSALPQEGKTVTILNLATVMAQSGSRVVVVDADLRRPTVHTHLEGPRSPGLTEALTEDAAWPGIARSTSVPNLSYIAAGSRHGEPGGLIESEAFRRLLEDLRAEFDLVIVDVPPVLAVADAASFFQSCDAVLLVGRYGVSTPDQVHAACDQVRRLGGRLIGSVFNGLDLRRGARHDSGYTGSYAHASYYAVIPDPQEGTGGPAVAQAGGGRAVGS